IGDLHVVDVFIVPDRFQYRVGEALQQDVLQGGLAQIMVDTVDLAFLQVFGDRCLQRLGGRQIGAERFFDDDAAPVLVFLQQVDRSQLIDDLGEIGRAHRQEVGEVLREDRGV